MRGLEVWVAGGANTNTNRAVLLHWLESAVLLSLARNLRYCNTTKGGDANAKPKKHRQARESNPQFRQLYLKKKTKSYY